MKPINADDAQLRPISEAFDLGRPLPGGWETAENGRTYRLTTDRGRFAVRNLGYTGGGTELPREYEKAAQLIDWQERLTGWSDVAARPLRTTQGRALYVHGGSTGDMFETRLSLPVVLSVHEWLDGGPPELQTPAQARTAGRAVGECLAKVHQFTWDADGYVDPEPVGPIYWSDFESRAEQQPDGFARRVLAIVPKLQRLEETVLASPISSIGCIQHGDVQASNVIIDPTRNHARLIDFDPSYVSYGSPVRELGRLTHEFAKVDDYFRWPSPEVETAFAMAATEGYVGRLDVQVNKADFVRAVTYEAAKRLDERVGYGPKLAESALARCEAGLTLAAKFDRTVKQAITPPSAGGLGF